MRILWICRYCSKAVNAALEERAQDSRKGAWILRCSTSRASLSLISVDNERNHGGGADAAG
jgi:hypothetical protein